MPYRTRDAEVIHAMQQRQYRWHGPLLDMLWRKPWKSPTGPSWSLNRSLRINASNLLGWLRNAHDCADPSVGCSCQGGFRFPTPKE